ncbi:acyl--CoA ligase [Streptomyces canus]|uniref:class I adenylate-forming enzyme family protein n=1 Tax=Streptomyces canus TaxID=58343 RepID=UPI0030E485CC
MPDALSTFEHIPALLAHQARRFPSRPAISVNSEAPLPYADWWVRSSAMSAVLRDTVQPGDPVALAFGSEHWPDFAEAYIACQLAGGVPVPAKPTMTESEWHRFVEGCGVRHVVLSTAGDQLAESVRARVAVHPHPQLRDVSSQASALNPGTATATPVSPLAHILHSSGTTGRPKAVAVTHRELLSGSRLPAGWAGLAMLHVMPPASAAGVEGVMLMALKSGVHATTVAPVEPADIARKARDRDTRVLLLLPSVALMCLRAGELAEPVTHPRLVILMGSATPPPVLRDLARAFPKAQILTHYGATEAGTAQLLMPFDAARPSAAGRAMGDTEVRVVDDEGRETGPGVLGEVLLRRSGAPGRHFFGETDGQASVFGPDGWVSTGDLGYLDESGYLYIVDRKKDIVVRGGQNIAPSEVESALAEHPAVLEASAFGVPHDLWGEMLVAAVVPMADAPVTVAELRRYLRARLAPFKIPSRITFVAELPRNQLGKVEKAALRRAHEAVAESGSAPADA